MYLWITDGSKSIKIGKKNKPYNQRIALYEANRRNNKEDVSKIYFPSEDIKKIVRFFALRIKWAFNKKYELSVGLAELMDVGYYTFAKCQKSYDFNIGCIFTTYFGKAFFRNAYKDFLPTSKDFQAKKKKMQLTNVNITQKLLSNCVYTTMQKETKKVEIDVEKLLKPLNDRQKYVIKSVIIDGKTYDQIGDKLGVSKQRIEQIYRNSMFILRRFHLNQD